MYPNICPVTGHSINACQGWREKVWSPKNCGAKTKEYMIINAANISPKRINFFILLYYQGCN